ncbi:MAG: transglutaminase domain-containing protein [Ruminococcus sp.]|nr:transglutaminase domain-containing protein [Ruminococcus sp.]
MKRKNIQNSNGISVCDSIVMSVKEKRTNLRKPFSVLIALVGYFSVILAFFGMFHINYDHGKIIMSSCLLAAFYIVLAVLEKKTLWLFIASLPVYVAAIYKKITRIVLGFKFIYNIIYSKSYLTEIQYYKGLRPSLEVDAATTTIFFYIWLLAIVIFFFTICRPNPILPLLVTFPVLEVGLYNGVDLPVIRGMLVIAYWLALLGMCTIDIGEYSGGQSGFVRKNNLFFPKRHMKLKVTEKCGAFIMASVLLVTFITAAVLKVSDYKRSDELNQKRRDLTEAASNFSIDNIAESLAELSNALGFEFKYENHKLGTNDHISYKNVTDIKVTIGYKPETAVYIKDYAGSDYHDNQWTDLPDGSYDDKRYADCEKYDINPQLFPYIFAPYVYPYITQGNMTIKSQLKNSKSFAPYCSMAAAEAKFDNDKMFTSHDPSAPDMSYSFYPMNSEVAALNIGPVQRGTYSPELITDESKRAAISEYCNENGLASYGDYFTIDHEIVLPDQTLYEHSELLLAEMLENNYKGFVYDNYLRVPDTEAMREVRSAYADTIGSGSYNTVQDKLFVLTAIRDRLALEEEYSLYPGKTPSNRDFVNYFLMENHKGYCIHYATAGVMLARMAGIPARYATGYVIVGDDFTDEAKNADGTYTIDVKDSRSHAWAEVYIDGFGWMPFEFTKGYSNTSVQPEAPVTTTADPSSTTTANGSTTRNSSRTSSNSRRTTGAGSITTSVQTTTTGSGGIIGFGKGGGKASKAVIYILQTLLAIAVTVGAVLLRRYVILRIRNNRFSGGNRSDRVGHIYSYTEQLLNKLNFENDDGKCVEFAKVVEERLGGIYFEGGGFDEMTQIALRSRFGNVKPDNDELTKCRQTAEKLASSMYSKKNRFGRLFMKYIDVLI